LVSQIVDLVAIRPEIRLNYLGLEGSCYQLVEKKHNSPFKRSTLFDPDTMDIDEVSEFNGSSSDANDDESMTDDDPLAAPFESFIQDNSDYGEEEVEESDEEFSEGEREEPSVSARQILFYDSMVSVFKARHGEIRQ
jgi:hypothetical protein